MKNQIVASILSVPFALGAVFAGTGVANAASLTGSVVIEGSVTSSESGGVTTFDFTSIEDIDTTGDFANFEFDFTGTGGALPIASPNFIDIEDLELTPTGFSSPGDLVSFLDFGERTLDGEVGNLTFDLSNPDAVDFLNQGPLEIASFTTSGVWQFNGETLADTGVTTLTVNEDGSYIIGVATSVPEPTALFGLGVVATGLVASRRKKNA